MRALWLSQLCLRTRFKWSIAVGICGRCTGGSAGGVAVANIALSPTTHGQDLAPTVHRNWQKAQDGLRSDRIEGSRREIRKGKDLKWWSLLAKKKKKESDRKLREH